MKNLVLAKNRRIVLKPYCHSVMSVMKKAFQGQAHDRHDRHEFLLSCTLYEESNPKIEGFYFHDRHDRHDTCFKNIFFKGGGYTDIRPLKRGIMSKYDPPKFDREIASQVEAELKTKYLDNQWSPGYIPEVIELCCKGDKYFFGHHGVFDLYLEKFQLYRNHCENCELDFYSNEPCGFCSENCELEYYQ